VRACLRRLAPDADAQAALIQYGLAETERQAGPGRAPAGQAAGPAAAAEGGGADGAGDARGEWLRLRIRLLQHRERLATLLALHDGWAPPPAEAPAFGPLRRPSGPGAF